MSLLQTMAIKIIQEQELVIGPLAWDEASKVKGLKLQNHSGVAIEGDEKEVVNLLVKQYSRLFGHASEEVCKDAVKDIIFELPADKVPSALR
ncbi:MAG: hypothetical protein HYV33_05225 [Candidatus Kerfeldbacteria bacterium]|nr:hypothetical protein [Candidatus Kerfeldbacteria bacterium]